LLIAERRGRISRRDRLITLDDFRRLPTTVDGRVGAYAWNDVLPHAERFRLTVYDATYLELAMRLDLPLATRDRDLADAGRRAGLVIFAT
jgi:predicted nucleic acid-binding protein